MFYPLLPGRMLRKVLFVRTLTRDEDLSRALRPAHEGQVRLLRVLQHVSHVGDHIEVTSQTLPRQSHEYYMTSRSLYGILRIAVGMATTQRPRSFQGAHVVEGVVPELLVHAGLQRRVVPAERVPAAVREPHVVASAHLFRLRFGRKTP